MDEDLNQNKDGNFPHLTSITETLEPQPSEKISSEEQESVAPVQPVNQDQEDSMSSGVGNQPACVTDPTTQIEPESPPVPALTAEEFTALREEKEDLYDRLLRKHAEFENFRKRTEKEKQDFYDFALSSFIHGLLPVLDGLERGLSAPEGETVENHKKGIELILKQFRDVLAAVGVQPIRATGKMFDPNYHQAVLREESAVLLENEIIEEMQRGYTFKDRLLRPSMVKVAIPAAAQPEEDTNVKND